MEEKRRSMYDEEEEESYDYRFLAVLLLIGIAWFFLRVKQEPMMIGNPPEPIGNADFWLVVSIPLLFLGKTSMSYLKTKSPGLVCNPIHTTTRPFFYRLGNIYAVFKMGGIDAYGIHYEGREGSLITPIDAVTTHGTKNFTVNGKAEKVPARKLPPSIRREIVEGNFPKPYYMVYTSETALKEPDVETLKDQYQQVCQVNSEQEITIEKLMKGHEEYAEHVQKMSATKKPLGETVKGWISGKQEED